MRPAHDLHDWLIARGGGARAADARAEGFTTHGIRRAIESGRVERVRKNWLVTADADPHLRMAAAAGGRVTCVSAASRLGLWVPPTRDDGVHVVVPPTASRVGVERLRSHWAVGPAPVPRSALVDPLLNVLFHVARCLHRDDALIIWESALRTRQVAAETLSAVQWRCEAARSLAGLAGDLSDSGLETRFVSIVRPLGVDVRQQVLIDGHRVDALIGEHLVVQLDGFAFHSGASRRADLRQDARLHLRGYTVIRFDFAQVFFEPDYVASIIAAAIAQGLHR